MLRRLSLAITLAVSIFVVLTGNAGAARMATPAEHEALANAVGTVPACVDARLATVQPGWARVRATNGEGCAPADGLVILRLVQGTWAIRYQGPADPSGPCAQIDGVPAAVGVDLGVCRALSKRVYLPRFDRLVYKPRLIVYGAHTGLRNLRWRGWGRSAATAHGVMDYADRTTSFRAPIHVRVSRIRPCGVKRTYLRMTVTFDRAADRRRWQALDGTTRYSCPS